MTSPHLPRSLAARERLALCDLALELGAAAPTLCAGWDARDLVVHLLQRERQPLLSPALVLPSSGVLGIVGRPLRRRAAAAHASLVEQPFPGLVTRLRNVPTAVTAVDPLVNTIEYFVHHEDLRRGQPDWEPRMLEPVVTAPLWRQLSLMGRLLAKPAGVPVVVESGARRAVLRAGSDPVVVSGPVGEQVLFFFGRTAVTGLSFAGPADKVERLKGATFGF